MKRILSIIIALVSLTAVHAQTDPYFPYPAVPESLPIGRPRANYMVEHFWDHCPWKSAFSSHKKMEGALREYAEIFPLAAADTVYASIDDLIAKVSKRPKDLVELAKMAEATFYADTAAFPQDDIYARFAMAIASHKKVPADVRARLNRQAQIINTSKQGAKLPELPLTLADGSTMALNDTTAGASEYILIFDTPDSHDGRMERLFLQANASANALIQANLIKPIFIYPGTPDAEWWADVASMPEGWVAAAMPMAADYIDMRRMPAVYVTDRSKVITTKWLSIPLLIQTCEEIMNQINRGQ